MSKRRKKRGTRGKRVISVIGISIVTLICLVGFAKSMFSSGNNRAEKETGTTTSVSKEDPTIPTTEPETEPEDDRITICIDAGHGGKDPGTDGFGRYEKDDVLHIAKLVKEELEKLDIHVVMTREEDVFLSIEDRKKLAKKAKAQATISLHRNAFVGSQTVNGVEVWINKESTQGEKVLASAIMSNIASVQDTKNRGVRTGSQSNPDVDYHLNEMKMDSCILELGFITDQHDNNLLDNYGQDYAKAIAKGIHEYVIAQTSS